MCIIRYNVISLLQLRWHWQYVNWMKLDAPVVLNDRRNVARLADSWHADWVSDWDYHFEMNTLVLCHIYCLYIFPYPDLAMRSENGAFVVLFACPAGRGTKWMESGIGGNPILWLIGRWLNLSGDCIACEHACSSRVCLVHLTTLFPCWMYSFLTFFHSCLMWFDDIRVAGWNPVRSNGFCFYFILLLIVVRI